MATAPAIEACGLVKTFGKGSIRALDGVSLCAEAGTVLGLLGPNGAGKTTAVRILSTITAPDAGRAAILGHDVVREPDRVRGIIGLAGQYATVDENLTGRENLRMIGRLSRLGRMAARGRADELLEQFGLAPAALMARPPVLFLDEPTTGLDPQSRQALWGIVDQLVKTGATVLLTTQYLEEADRLAHRVAVVDHGRVIAEGTPAELKADLGTTVLAVTTEEADRAQVVDLLRALTGKEPVVDGQTVELTVEDGPKTSARVLRALDERGLAVLGLTVREPSLDDVFLTLTGHRAESGDEGGREPRHDGSGS